MKRSMGWLMIAGYGATFAIHVNGCSLIGLGTGSAIDARTPPFEQVGNTELARIEPGTRVSLRLRDSTHVHGTYRGSVRLDDDAYRALYDAWRARHPRGAAFPEIGERVELTAGGKGPFRGFVAEGIDLSLRWAPASYQGDGWLVRRDGTRLDRLEIRTLALVGQLPIATDLRIQTDAGERRIPVDRILTVEWRNARRAAFNGFVAGLVADVVIVLLVREAMKPKPITCDYTPTPGGFWSRTARATEPEVLGALRESLLVAEDVPPVSAAAATSASTPD